MPSSNNKIESALVSLTGTLIYLQGLANTVAGRPIIPRSIEAYTPRTQGALAQLKANFLSAMAFAEAEAEPFLAPWLGQAGLSLGGGISASTAKNGSVSAARTLRVQGGIVSAKPYPYLVSGVRVVDLELVDGELALPDGRVVQAVSDIPVRERAHFNLMALRDVEVVDPLSQKSSTVLHVRVPIQQVQRTNWTRNKTWVPT